MKEHPRRGVTAVIDDAATLLAEARRARDEHGDLCAARLAFEAAYRDAERAGDPAAMAESALGLGGIWVYERRSATDAALLQSRLEYALSRVDPRSTLALRLRARLAAEADYQAGRHAAALRILDEARADGDPDVRIETLSLVHHCLLGPDHARLRRVLADEMIGESARAGRRADVLMALLWRAVDRFLDGDPHAERCLGELRARLHTGRHQAIGYVADSIDVMLAIRAGRLDYAERLAVVARGSGVSAGDEDATTWYGAQLVAIRWFQGRIAELRPMLAELVHSPLLSPVDNSFFAALAIAAAASGDRPTASGALAALCVRDLDDLPRSSSWLVTLYGIVEAAHLLGETGPSARAYDLLRPYAGRPMMASLGVSCFGSTHHALGVASLTLGETDRAVGHFRDAVEANLAIGHRPAAAASRWRLVEVLERRDAPGDAAEAYEQRGLAAEIAGNHPAPAAATRAATCTRHGRQWRVQVGPRAVLVEHSVGLLHLAVLTANPGVEIAATELVAGVDALGRAARPAAMSAQPVLDRPAVRGYRQRIAHLDDIIDAYAASGDHDAAAVARAEREWVTAELDAGTGLGGRVRAFTDGAELARLAVGKSIRRAIAHIGAADPAIGAHLRDGVHTGARCWYRPV